jgi:hypothetical protein
MYKLKPLQNNIEQFKLEAKIDDIVNEYSDLCEKIKKLEDLKKSLSNRIKLYMNNNSLKEYGSNRFTVSLNTVTRRTLDKILLREMGIDDETIELCSKESVYQQLVVR